MSVDREMTLAEWCAKLPSQHVVNRELAELTKQLAALAEQSDLVRAEENEAIIAAANALENIASTSSSTRIRRVANDALKAIRARRNHG